MSLPKYALYILTAWLALQGVSFAQSDRLNESATLAASGPQPLDLRVGSIRPSDPVPEIQASPRPHNPVVAIGRDYRVGPNDLIDVDVFDLDNVKRTVRVNAAGAISLPLIGAVTVAGLTSQEVEQRIADRYREKYLQNPQVSVFIKEFTTERITVEGAVTRPGIYPLAGRITLLRALALAGGFGTIANTSEVMLFRMNDSGAREVAVFDVELIRSGKHDDPSIRGDDLIVVQRDATRRMLKDSLFRDIIDSINPFSAFGR
ncbi:MAG TPA: polysaccharide biosynthesis/export family protein [Ramlibacter sp.]|nr:polysaccharide biosynthesis/export family protein [Ramlibacter sp.]